MKLVLTLLRVIMLAAAVAGGFLAGSCYGPKLWPRVDAPPVIHASSVPTIEAVQKLSLLVVTRVNVADVVETKITGHAGGITAVLVVRGDVQLGVDLNRASFASFSPEGRTAIVRLPLPSASAPRLDQSRTRLLYVSRDGLWGFVPCDPAELTVINHAYGHAQDVIAAAGADPDLIEGARRNAESTIVGFFETMRWKVTVEWVP